MNSGQKDVEKEYFYDLQVRTNALSADNWNYVDLFLP